MDDDPAAAERSADTDPEPDTGDVDAPAPGLVEFRTALVGLGLIWLTVVSAFGTVLAAVYGLTVSVEYLLASAVAAAVAVAAGLAALRAFGYR